MSITSPCRIDCSSGIAPHERGVTLIELIVFIVIVGIALAGVIGVLSRTNLFSVDPQIRKQTLAIAEALLEEIELQPFTYCDPDDPAVSTATKADDCAIKEAAGPEGDEKRGDSTNRWDNVSDYHGLTMDGTVTPITDITGAAIGGLAGYKASVTVVNEAKKADALGLDVAEVLHITVTVTPPHGDSITLDGYRARYAPRIL